MTDEPSADPVAERRAVGREMSRKVGFPAWQVRVDVRSHRDVVALAGYLAAQGWRVRRRLRHLLVGADCEDDAEGLVGSSPVTAALMRRHPSGSGGSAIATCCLTPPAPRSSAGPASARPPGTGRRQALPGDGSKARDPRQWRERIAVHHADAASAGRLAGPDRDLARRVDPVQGDADGCPALEMD